jgi:hypothetical protein
LQFIETNTAGSAVTNNNNEIYISIYVLFAKNLVLSVILFKLLIIVELFNNNIDVDKTTIIILYYYIIFNG